MINCIFSKLQPQQKKCLLIFDEMYVLPSLRFRANHLLGEASDQPDKLARRILSIMVKPLCGGPAFLLRMVPVYLLTAQFLFNQLACAIRCVQENEGDVVALVCDNHPVNRACYNIFNDHCNQPWMGKLETESSHTFILLFDTVHLLKSIRNNWYSEKAGEILWTTSDGQTAVAKWSDIEHLYRSEAENVVRRTRLSMAACYPSNIDKQKVSLTLAVFDEKTIAALQCDGRMETASFVTDILRMWKIVNVKNPILASRLNDPNRKPIERVNDENLLFLESMANRIEVRPLF